MSESERRQRVISSAPHLSVEEVANRSFASKMRGFAEPEVRTFLKRVSDELGAARERERELLGAVDELEAQLRAPRPLSEQELLDALGEETARLLRSAREASDDIRKKAEERAARVVEDAQVAAERARAEASEALASRTQHAEAKVADMVGAAEAHAAELRELAASEVVSVIETARHQGREMLDEAMAARERVLGDLVRRRALLRAQIEELRGGRDRLLDAYRTVKRTFLDATEALGHVEARTAAERSTTAEPIDIAAEIASEIEALDAAAPHALDGDGADVESVRVVDLVAAERDVDADDDAATKLADVDSLFARLRAGHDDTDPLTTIANGPAAGAAATTALATATIAAAGGDVKPRVDATQWRARRATAVEPLLAALVKRAKRAAQDDQNALLDAVRRHKGRPSAQQVLPDAHVALHSWATLLREAVDGAYGAGRESVGAAAEAAPDELVREAAESAIVPLRERLTIAIDSGEEGDTGGLVERIGARSREWKNQALDRVLGEVLAFSWTRGVYDASPDGTVLRWVPFEEGRCTDCDDNALEPTVKGKPFPTGQPFPPAHPGCKCLLAPADALKPLTASK